MHVLTLKPKKCIFPIKISNSEIIDGFSRYFPWFSSVEKHNIWTSGIHLSLETVETVRENKNFMG